MNRAFGSTEFSAERFWEILSPKRIKHNIYWKLKERKAIELEISVGKVQLDYRERLPT